MSNGGTAVGSALNEVGQAVEQLAARLERGAPPREASAGREAGMDLPAWSWRLAGDKTGGARAEASPVSPGDGGRNSDWSGGQISSLLGLTGRPERDAAPRERGEARWSALAALGGERAAAERLESDWRRAEGLSGGLSGSGPGSTAASGQSSPLFGGAAGNPAPNPQLPGQLGQQIQWMTGKGLSRANIELRPADLGPLKIAIETQGDETRIALTATNPTTQSLLEQQLPRLREWLQEAGLANSQVDVGLSDDGGALADGAAGDGEGGEAAAGEPGGGDSGLTEAQSDRPGGLAEVEGRWVLDLFA
jgi:hypothetical protein